jgi:argininosuccinate lyase
MTAMHLSRWAEQWIIYMSTEFSFIKIADKYTTGSSMMPQKKNPDMAELTRGKTGRLYGNLVSILTTLKALPSSYNRDLQEDKEPLFDSIDTINSALDVFRPMVAALKINRDKMRAAAADPDLLATDLAEYLVKKGMPFRKAHETVGQLVADCVRKSGRLSDLPISKFKKV